MTVHRRFGASFVARVWRRRARRGAAALLAVTSVVGATAAGSMGVASASAETKTTFTYAYPQEPPNWDYRETALTAVTAPLLLNVWETVLEMNADGTVSPLLAESYEVSDDGLVYTLQIREGVMFHDGSELTSADVVYSFNANAEASVPNTSAAFTTVTSIEAPDDFTVVLTLEVPSQSFLGRMANRAGIIVPEGFFEDNDPGTTVIGTGPYTLGEYRIDQDLTLQRFDDYWGEQPFFETVVQRFMPDETAAINALIAGEIDMVASVIGEGMDRVSIVAEENENIDYALVPGTEVSFWALNPNVEAFQDIRVRQAIQYGHDRQAHVDAATAGTATVSCSMAVPAGVPWDTDECAYPYDPDMARSLLEEAGVTDLEVDFPYPEAAWHPIMAQVFQAEMADIGITVNLQNQDLATWLDQVNTQGQFDIYQITAGWTLPEFACGAGLQPFGHPDQVDFCDEGMDALIEGIDAIVDYDEYVARQQELDRYVAEQGWIFATKKPNVPTLFRSDLVGLVEHRLPDIHIDVRGLHWAE